MREFLYFTIILNVSVCICGSRMSSPMFVRNACYEHGSDVRFMKMTYDVCVENCVRRASCVSVNFHAQMGYCVLHTVDAITEVPCALDGMIFSKKADWTEERKCLPSECASCTDGQTCVHDASKGTDTCQITECKELPAPPSNGRIMGNMLSVGSRIKYQCDTLYVLGQATSRTCLETGEWSLPEPVCVSVCPEDGISYNNSCYFYTRAELDFTNALNYCQSLSVDPQHVPHLATFETPDEHNSVTQSMQDLGQTGVFWLGIRRKGAVADNTWYYEHTGEDATWFDWYDGEPNNWRGTQEDCVGVMAHTWQYNDVRCDQMYFPLCEIS